jgi:hypothetical protein
MVPGSWRGFFARVFLDPPSRPSQNFHNFNRAHRSQRTNAFSTIIFHTAISSPQFSNPSRKKINAQKVFNSCVEKLVEKRPFAHKTPHDSNRLCVLHHDSADSAFPVKHFEETMHSRVREEFPSGYQTDSKKFLTTYEASTNAEVYRA